MNSVPMKTTTCLYNDQEVRFNIFSKHEPKTLDSCCDLVYFIFMAC